MAEEIYAPIIDTQMTLQDALYQVVKISKGNNTLRAGFRQVCKSIIRKQSKVILLSKDYPDNLFKIVHGLAKQNEIPIIKIETNDELSKIAGFEKIKADETSKIGKCGCLSILDFVEDSEGKYFLENVLTEKAN